MAGIPLPELMVTQSTVVYIPMPQYIYWSVPGVSLDFWCAFQDNLFNNFAYALNLITILIDESISLYNNYGATQL